MCYNVAMDKRRLQRLRVNLKAERISGRGNHTVFIENISEQGILILIPHSSEIKKFRPGTGIDLKFKLNSGKAISLNCKVRWSYPKTPPEGLTDSIGLEIIEPPDEYRNFVKALN